MTVDLKWVSILRPAWKQLNKEELKLNKEISIIILADPKLIHNS